MYKFFDNIVTKSAQEGQKEEKDIKYKTYSQVKKLV